MWGRADVYTDSGPFCPLINLLAGSEVLVKFVCGASEVTPMARIDLDGIAYEVFEWGCGAVDPGSDIVDVVGHAYRVWP